MKYEGAAYQINTANPANSSPAAIREHQGGFYLYSADPTEESGIQANLAKTWHFEGQACTVSANTGAPVWRFRNKGNGTYLYSADKAEKDSIVANLGRTWLLEGPAYYLAP